jgi:hypothetical protein
MLFAKPWERPSAVAALPILILLSAGINSFTRCTVAPVAVSTGRPGRVTLRISRHSYEPLYRQTLPAVNRKYFFISLLCIEPFAHKKRTTETCFSVV